MWAPSNGRLELGGVKNIERGTEKVDHAYGGDVSRLLDVCRGRIVFEKIEDLCDCLSALADDETVSIVRIKSSMTKSGLKPVVNTGIRFVSVNMRISSSRTRKLGVSAHVCELLLMLRPDAQASMERHEEYMRHRNSLAAFHLTIIPGSDIMYEGRRLSLAFGSYLSDLISSKKSNKILPQMDLGARPTRGILRVRQVDERKLSQRALSGFQKTELLPPVKLAGSGLNDFRIPVLVQGQSFGRTESGWSAPRQEDQEDEISHEESEKEDKGGGDFGRAPSAWSAARLEDKEDEGVSASGHAPAKECSDSNTLVSVEDALLLLRENTAMAKIKKSSQPTMDRPFEFVDSKTEDEQGISPMNGSTPKRRVRWVWHQVRYCP